MGSKPGKLDGTDFKKLGKGLLIAVGGAAVTYLAEWTGEADFGAYTPIVTAAAAFGINLVRKLIADYAKS